MSRSVKLLSFYLSLLIVIALFTGCGGGGGSVSSSEGVFRGVEAVGSLSGTPRSAVSRAAAIATMELNPYYTNGYLVPEQYSVALTKFELMKSADDPSPYVVFDTGDLAAPKVVSLASGESASFGENTALPPTGTYTHVRMSVVYFQLQFQMDPGDGLQSGTFRAYASSIGNIKNGDIVQLREGNWYWLPSSQAVLLPDFSDAPFTSTTDQGPRPDNNSGFDSGNIARSIVAQEFHFSQPDSQSVDPFVQVLPLAEPIVIPANPTGKYQVVTTFDVTASALDSSATGLFIFDDVDNDGIFEPGPGYGDTNGAGRDYNDGTHGEPMFNILPPQIYMSATIID